MLDSDISIPFSLLRPCRPISGTNLPERRKEGATPKKKVVNNYIQETSVRTPTGPTVCLSEDYLCIRPTYVHRASGPVRFLMPHSYECQETL